MRHEIHQLDHLADRAGDLHCRLAMLTAGMSASALRDAADRAAALLDQADEMLTRAAIEARETPAKLVESTASGRPE